MIVVNYNNKFYELKAVKYLNIAFTKIKKGTLTIWEIIKSCFGSGLWKNNSNWLNNENWKN